VTRPADLDEAGRLLAILGAQRGLRDPLPVALVEAVDSVDDLGHFAAVRRSQEEAG
jgi:hypothetical protein